MEWIFQHLQVQKYLQQEMVLLSKFAVLTQDMVDMYLFLSGPAADNITGQSFTVDRGELMQ